MHTWTVQNATEFQARCHNLLAVLPFFFSPETSLDSAFHVPIRLGSISQEEIAGGTEERACM